MRSTIFATWIEDRGAPMHGKKEVIHHAAPGSLRSDTLFRRIAKMAALQFE
jgi:hypothetical protein